MKMYNKIELFRKMILVNYDECNDLQKRIWDNLHDDIEVGIDNLLELVAQTLAEHLEANRGRDVNEFG